jgi:hypothetical protein
MSGNIGNENWGDKPDIEGMNSNLEKYLYSIVDEKLY